LRKRLPEAARPSPPRRGPSRTSNDPAAPALRALPQANRAPSIVLRRRGEPSGARATLAISPANGVTAMRAIGDRTRRGSQSMTDQRIFDIAHRDGAG